MITTNSDSPFASGQWTDATSQTKIGENLGDISRPKSDPFQQQIDQWGKLEGAFNNVDITHKRVSPNAGATGGWDGNQLQNLYGSLRTPPEVRMNDKFSESDNYFIQYRYNLTKNIISDDQFQFPQVRA